MTRIIPASLCLLVLLLAAGARGEPVASSGGGDGDASHLLSNLTLFESLVPGSLWEPGSGLFPGLGAGFDLFSGGGFSFGLGGSGGLSLVGGAPGLGAGGGTREFFSVVGGVAALFEATRILGLVGV